MNEVRCCDWADLMQSLPDKSVDALIADPPYNLTHLAFEQSVDWPLFWQEARRVLVVPESPVVLFSQQPFTTDLILSNRTGYRMEVIYEKTMPVGYLNANRRPMQAHENILVFADREPYYEPQMDVVASSKTGVVRKQATEAEHYGKHRSQNYTWSNKRYPRSVWRFANRKTFNGSDVKHKTMKPLALMERLVLSFTKRGWLVLDPFCGSGSTLLAARNTGRHYLGGDNDPKQVAVACQRLALPFTVGMFD